MKTLRPFFGLTVGVVLLSGFAVGCSKSTKSGVPAPGAIVITPTGATNFTSKESRFSMALPAKPIETKRSEQAEGQTYQISQFQTASTPIVYLVLAISIPAQADVSDTGKFLDGVQSGFLKSGQAQLTGRRELSLNGTPGRELRCTIQNGAVASIARIYALPNISYQVMAVGAKKDVEAQAAQIDKVLTSFRIDAAS